MKCATPNCTNFSHQGTFIGDFCSPCNSHHSGKKSIFSQAYRNEVELIKKIKTNDPVEGIHPKFTNGEINFTIELCPQCNQTVMSESENFCSICGLRITKATIKE